METAELIKKYSVPVPRYTSYPTVPYWDETTFSYDKWINSVRESFTASNKESGISLYIHLPFCENLCTYCGCNTRITKNHSVEIPYINAVIREWELYKLNFDEKPIVKELHLGGGTPTFFSSENLNLLINGILTNCELHSNAEFSFEAHPANTTEQHLETLYKLGFKRLSLGIQDFDKEVQKVINRMQSYEQVEYVTNTARKIGYTSINYDLIYGLPLQKLSGLIQTITQVNQLRPDRIAFYSYAHVPWIKPGQRMFTELDLPDTEAKQELYETGRKLFIEAGYEEVGMDHFALKSDSLFNAQENKTLHRNFMGYTHQYTELMIGLGVSSISDTWNAFAQNVKTVEEYKQLIAEDTIPVFKGHLLDSEDLLMRKHILNIMCHGETTWNDIDLLNDSFSLAFDNLEEVVKDGLVEKHDYTLKVTKRGTRFLRNICAAFDMRLWRKQPERQLFSIG
ncbi:oxygen-independent coproporphyrinogen III oxidase [Pseudopedobacter saltans DSM 12145]|uniref:Coproporphyrinogen-III oxidase n=1 Tax=Pseudopedobacter saltans (strain ATCC 51119 / DSM 12145 / JCM 21818 / CCUG 39354 / LMG 10337 / NBRC 100064 / NCIMB 13643) TaxID=762903 RepID=F0S540_PSESL|nr:oxygen-independent coproporphyrinogen III oxidase [Pseudopedobacter saltans]ADY50957.1 oxygen-independent coproporphyrinogen III oxidase [Pseudopedobacter saltans DSM 12145]